MDWNILINTETRLVRVKVNGEFMADGCMAIKKEMISLEGWEPGFNVLMDYRQTTFSQINLAALRAIVAFHEQLNEQLGNGKMAFLMNSPRDFGLARQYEMISEGKVLSHIRVFVDEQATVEWLTGN